ncbi:hypothetical protein QAD02_003101 [Eretmocerus hayati]|uniref:Uncharacterized protein n=1 Tax=Eretmocerus hayati TaxID=131215 RepID=A0ACC2NL75_9HYME|nr:hypothetical protein QAD02_003101 [Eretmocerus hayati]
MRKLNNIYLNVRIFALISQGSLQTVHQQYWIKLETLEDPARAGRPVGCSTNSSGIDRENFIKEKWAEYGAGDITVNDSVISCARYDDRVDTMYGDDESSPAVQNDILDDEDDSVEMMYLKNGPTEELVENQNCSVQADDDSPVPHQRIDEEVTEACPVYNTTSESSSIQLKLFRRVRELFQWLFGSG